MALYPCPECASSISERARACPKCGAAWQGVCPECHEFRVPDSEACGNCGHPFSKLTNIKLSTIKESAESIARGAKNVYPKKLGFGTLWFRFWVYVRAPIGALWNLLLAFAFPDFFLLALGGSVFFVAVAVGLHKRRLWAWKANWILVLEPIVATALAPFIFGYGVAEEIVGALFIAGLILVIWVLPNWFYFMKRKPWFATDLHRDEKDAPETKVSPGDKVGMLFGAFTLLLFVAALMMAM